MLSSFRVSRGHCRPVTAAQIMKTIIAARAGSSAVPV